MNLEATAQAELERRCLRFIPAGQFLGPITPPDWVLDGVAESDNLSVLFGDPGTGKSFLAMDWAACVATGTPWHGRRVKAGPVLYINGEGRNGINRRFTAWGLSHGLDLRKFPLFLSSTTTALTDETGRVELEAVISDFMADHGPPVMVVVDTLSRNFGPGDENSTQEMTRAVAALDAIKDITRAWVLVVHHSSHADKGRGRGSIALPAAADSVYRLTKVDEAARLDCTKIKDGVMPEPVGLKLQDVGLDTYDAQGREICSAVLVPIDPPQSNRTKPKGKNQLIALDHLRELEAMHGEVQLDLWKAMLTDEGLNRNRVHEVIQSLEACGAIKLCNGLVSEVR